MEKHVTELFDINKQKCHQLMPSSQWTFWCGEFVNLATWHTHVYLA